LQIPFHHKRNVERVLDYIFESKIDGIFCVGDEIDVAELGAFNKGTRKEFEGTLQKNFNLTHSILAQFREALGSKKKPFLLQRSNHSQRIEKYIYKNAPAFESVTALRIENLLGLNKLGITYNRQMDFVAPGVIMGHGDEGRMYTTAGLTGLNLALRTGQNVVCGHTHRQGISKASRGFGGRLNTIWGMEVGHLMDLNSSGALYIREKSANWQQGFALLYVEGNHVVPQLVPINSKGKFIADGKEW
jgi:predicted phosphodiesterase